MSNCPSGLQTGCPALRFGPAFEVAEPTGQGKTSARPTRADEMAHVDGESMIELTLDRAVDASEASPLLRMRRSGHKEKGLSTMDSAERPSSISPGRVALRLSRFRSGWRPESFPFAPWWAPHHSLPTGPGGTARSSGHRNVEGVKRGAGRGPRARRREGRRRGDARTVERARGMNRGRDGDRDHRERRTFFPYRRSAIILDSSSPNPVAMSRYRRRPTSCTDHAACIRHSR